VSEEEKALRDRMAKVSHKVLVLSGKGGVGKSTVAVNLAVALSMAGKSVGLLDVDIHGPSVPKMLGLEGSRLVSEDESIVPIELGDMRVMSIGFLLQDPDQAVIWRGPKKIGAIRQFLGEVAWGKLDYLIVDCPPGTGDEPLTVAQYLKDADGAVIVTTPQEVAVVDVRKCVTFCRDVGMKVLGVVENMSGFACPKCGEVVNVFKSGGGEEMALQMGIPFLGRAPLSAAVVESGDTGRPCVHHRKDDPAAKAFQAIADEMMKKMG